MPKNIQLNTNVFPYPPGAVVARHALKDPDWILRSKAGEETDAEVTVVVEYVPPVPKTATDAEKQNVELRLQLGDLPARMGIARAEADAAKAELATLFRDHERLKSEHAAMSAIADQQAAEIQHLKTQAAIDARK